MALGPLMVGVAGLALSDEERELLRHPVIGGVILFTRNYADLEQLQALVADIRSLRQPPLLVAVDHEGGRVQRFQTGFTRLPALRHLGHLYDRDTRRAKHYAQLSGWLMAAELRAVGIDMSFAPVLDLDRGTSVVIGDRAFHTDPEAVADLAHAYMIGMDMAGMAATAKHFPGHGTAAADSHQAVVTDHRPWEDIVSEDMLPFERMVNFGIAAIMVAHIIYPRVDTKPAGFSRYWIHEVLRQRLGFQGAIISDDIGMVGAAGVGGLVERAHAALEAGCDLVLLCNELAEIPAVIDAMGNQSNPAGQLRLARMHGRGRIERAHLRLEPIWHEALQALADYARPSEPDLV